MKKLIGLLMAAVLLCAPASALQSIVCADIGELYGDYVCSAAADGGTLYICGDFNFYTWRQGEEVSVYTLDIEAEDAETYRGIRRIFVRDGRPWALLVDSVDNDGAALISDVSAAELILSDGTATLGERFPLDRGPLVLTEDGCEYLCTIKSIACEGDRLCVCMYDANYEPQLCILDLTDGSCAIAPVEQVEGLCACGGNRILLETYDYETEKLGFGFYDLNGEKLEPACEPLDGAQCKARGGLAWDAENEKLYYVSGGFLWEVENFDFANAQIAAELSGAFDSDTQGMLTGDGVYAICGDSGVTVRSVDPQDRVERYLKIRDNLYAAPVTAAQQSFNAEHGDISAALVTDDRDEETIAEELLNGTCDTDIVVLPVAGEAFDAIYESGCMADLGANADVRGFVGAMYPAFREVCECGGRTVAVPVQVYAWTTCADIGGFEALGISVNDIPTDWPAFLDFLNGLPSVLPQDGSVRAFDPYMSLDDVRWNLFYAIMNDYAASRRMNGEAVVYDTPELKALLSKLEETDLSALGLYTAEETDGEDCEYDAVSHILFENGRGCIIGDYPDGRLPLLLSVDADTPSCLRMEMYAAFVNPACAEPEAALDFLSKLIANANDNILYNVSDRENGSRQFPDYAETAEMWEEEINGLREELAAADETDRVALEAQIAEYEGYAEESLINSWEISPESIEWYRTAADRIIVERGGETERGDAEAVYELYSAYLAGDIDAETMLRDLDGLAE